jgi:hypothetical protein
MKKLIILVLLLAAISCEEALDEIESLGSNAAIVGTWVDKQELELDFTAEAYDGSMRLTRAAGLDSTRYGFIIRKDGTFTERKNAGWCGTPPITYANFEGTWEALSDSLLDITVGYWGGTMTYQMRIISLDEESLRIRILYADNRVNAGIE